MSLPAIFGFLLEHADIFQLLFDLITNGKLSKDQVTKAIQDAVVAASDAEMQREFPA